MPETDGYADRVLLMDKSITIYREKDRHINSFTLASTIKLVPS
jgi:hypothetical protein